MRPEKHFIVVERWEQYDAVIRAHRLDPSRCFICFTPREAATDVAINRAKGIPARIWTMTGPLTGTRSLPVRGEEQAA